MREGASRGTGGSYAAIQAVDPGLESLDDFSNAAHLVELDLQLVDLAQYGAEACDFGVGHLDRVTRAVVLHLSRSLCLLCELERVSTPSLSSIPRDVGISGAAPTTPTYIVPSLLDRKHQTVEVGAERLEAGGIQEEAALAGGVRSGARRVAALLRSGNLLLEETRFA